MLRSSKFASVCLGVLTFGLALGIASAQTVSVLPNAETQFVDGNGAPYAAGKVYFYVPGTTTPKATWVDTNATTLNSNPVVLDSAGRALIYGSGQYREVLQDQFGNTIWDQQTWAPNPSTNMSFANGTLAGNSSGAIGGLNAITIGSGLTLTGSTLSAAAAYQATVADTTNQSVVIGFNSTQRLATGSLTYTLPLANTLTNGFTFKIYSLTNSVTITPYSTDVIQGLGTGVSLVIPPSQVLTLTTNAAGNWYYTSTSYNSTPGLPCGRITLTSATPVLTSTVNSASSVLYTPYLCNTVPIVISGQLVSLPFTEYSQSLSDTTLSPAAAVSGANYDIFGWLSGSSVVFTRGPAWSSTSSRGYTLSRVGGVLVNTSNITNGPAALSGVYLGTIMTDTTTATVTFAPQPNAASGGPTTGSSGQNAGAWVGLWNEYNRISVPIEASDSKTSWTPTLSNTWQTIDGSNNNRVNLVVGNIEDALIAGEAVNMYVSGGGSMAYGIAVNTPATPAYFATTNVNGNVSYSSTWPIYPALGLNYLQGLQNAGGTTGYTYAAVTPGVFASWRY